MIQRYTDAIVLCRFGDFDETLDDDARTWVLSNGSGTLTTTP